MEATYPTHCGTVTVHIPGRGHWVLGPVEYRIVTPLEQLAMATDE